MTAKTKKLKPCPFCGGKTALGYFAAWCIPCGAKVKGDTQREVVANWNRRPSKPEPVYVEKIIRAMDRATNHQIGKLLLSTLAKAAIRAMGRGEEKKA